MKKSTLIKGMIIASTMFATTTTTMAFDDVKPNDWYYTAVTELEKAGVVSGYNGKFNPNGLVTEAELTKMVHNATVQNEADKDLKPTDSNWYSGYYSYYEANYAPKARPVRYDAAAMEQNVVDWSRYGKNSIQIQDLKEQFDDLNRTIYKPSNATKPATRYMAAYITADFIEESGIDLGRGYWISANAYSRNPVELRFPEREFFIKDTESEMSDTAHIQFFPAIQDLMYYGIMGGKSNGKFDGNGNLTRAEAAAIVYRILDVKSRTNLIKDIDNKIANRDAWTLEKETYMENYLRNRLLSVSKEIATNAQNFNTYTANLYKVSATQSRFNSTADMFAKYAALGNLRSSGTGHSQSLWGYYCICTIETTTNGKYMDPRKSLHYGNIQNCPDPQVTNSNSGAHSSNGVIFNQYFNTDKFLVETDVQNNITTTSESAGTGRFSAGGINRVSHFTNEVLEERVDMLIASWMDSNGHWGKLFTSDKHSSRLGVGIKLGNSCMSSGPEYVAAFIVNHTSADEAFGASTNDYRVEDTSYYNPNVKQGSDPMTKWGWTQKLTWADRFNM